MFNFNIEKKVESNEFARDKLWDLIIIGGGPAGLNAGLYAKRKGLEVLIIANEIGGQLHNTTAVDNYLGFKLITGKALSDQFYNHLENLEVQFLTGKSVKKVEKFDYDFSLTLSDGKILTSKTILVSTGGSSRKLEVKGENKYANKGVSYCTICDAPFFKDKHVIIAGGGNSAAEAVLDLVPWAKKITVVHRSNWRADQILLDKLNKVDNLTIYLNTQILEILGAEQMTGVKVLDKTDNSIKNIEADGLFIEIGTVPNSNLIKDLVKTNERLEVIVDEMQMTSLEGLFAAGDITAQPYKQIIISAAEGAKAALAVNQYLNHNYKGDKKI